MRGPEPESENELVIGKRNVGTDCMCRVIELEKQSPMFYTSTDEIDVCKIAVGVTG